MIAAQLTAQSAAQGAGFWLPTSASSQAPAVDALFYFILGVSTLFFLLILVLSVLFVIRYHRRPGHAPQPSPSHNTALEITWSAIPLLIVMVIFVWGLKIYLDEYSPPADAYEIQVTGMKWKWQFTYPNGHIDENLHVPLDVPVRLVLTSEDVIHSLFVPAFRIKRDVVPGRYSSTWFKATETGEYAVYCAEYCGSSHSDMLAKAIVHPRADFDSWLASAGDLLAKLPPDQAGEMLYKQRGCVGCHTVDGTRTVGPSFKGLFGHQVTLTSGARVTADENYIRRSMLEPQAEIVEGFAPVMPTFQGRLKDAEINAIIAYMKTMKD